jgi:hypothetical protein
VTRDAVEGVEITLPKFGFGETHYIASGMVTFGYAFALRQLTGTVNQSAFRAFAPGEVLFLGASGRMRGQEDWEISYKFAASPNKTGLSVGAITGIVKRGWDYLWVRYQDDVDTTANAIVRRPLAVYVEQVYTYADWSPMGIY